jgi:hypothetical protein
MRTHRWLSVCVLAGGALTAAAVVGSANAQTPAAPSNVPATAPSAISYPVAELGNCADASACRAYCDNSAHVAACLTFAEQHGLMTKDEVALAKKMTSGKLQGPGGCTTKDTCEAYCDDIAHIEECVSFAEAQGALPPEKLAEAKKVQAAIARGVKPPPCKNKEACDAYCSDPNNMEVCINFGKEAGFMSPQEQADADKMLAALRKGVKPPACQGKEACDAYCQSPDHMEECMNFALAAGLMKPEEQANAQGMLKALKQGVKPPACQGKEACDAYCQSPEHMDECINFSVAAGFMKPEEAAMAKKTGGKGPGGCRGKDECDAFCNQPANQQTCFDFGVANGMISPDQVKQIEQGKQQFQQTITQAPPEVTQCLKDTVGADKLAAFTSGSAMPPKDIGDQMRTCFEKFKGSPQGGGPNQQCTGDNCPPPGPGGQGGGGQFQPGPGTMNPGGQMMPQQAGPGGCKGPEECQAYCASHEEECRNFRPTSPGGQPGEQQPMGPQQGQAQPGARVEPCEGENCAGGPQPGQIFRSLLPLQQGNELQQGNVLQPGTEGGGQAGPVISPGGPGPNPMMNFAPGTAPGTVPGGSGGMMQPRVQQPMGGFVQPQQQPGQPGPGGTMPPQGSQPQQGLVPQAGFAPPPLGGQQPMQAPLPSGGGGVAPPPSGGGGGAAPPPLGGGAGSIFGVFAPLLGF